MYTRIIRFSSGKAMLASMALSNRLPMMQHKSSSDIFSFTGMWASTCVGMFRERAREILLLRMASAIGLPVFTTVSTVLRSVSNSSR